jgi:hypothetical protein
MDVGFSHCVILAEASQVFQAFPYGYPVERNQQFGQTIRSDF